MAAPPGAGGAGDAGGEAPLYLRMVVVGVEQDVYSWL